MEMAWTGGKILVIDDLEDWRDMIGGLLEEAGYNVDSAASADDAMRLLRQQPYHVAVVDQRLDEQDESNQEGLALAERMKAYLPELAIIILTGYANIDAVKHALKPQENGLSIAFDFLEKHEIAKLLQRIEIAFAKAAKVNPQLEISLESGLEWSRLQNDIECLQSLNLEAARLEVTDLLRRIFHQAQRVEIEAMNDGYSSGAVVLVRPTMRGIAQTDVVVKFNEREKAKQESHNYDNYVENYVGGARRTQRLDFRATARLGGIAYSFVGAEATEFQRFSHSYALKDTASIITILDNLFEETCYNWYTKTLKTSNRQQSLSAGYKEWLRLDPQKLATALTEIVKDTKATKLSFSDPRRPTQSGIFLEDRGIKLENPLPLSYAPFAYSGPECFTHGDLHEGNILIDSHSQTWLIDFYHTGPGHPVRDFAMLESAIKFSLQKSTCSPSILYDWERSIVQVESLHEEPTSDPPLQLDAELLKATELIQHLRALLSQILPEMTIQDYQIALYFHALKGLSLRKKFNERQRLHSLISTALLAESL
jgi:ActR/RegA family two-component response regulator